jgi:hypothetical protein
MKKIVLFSLAVLISLRVTGQSQAETFIKEAQDFLTKKEYKQALLSLQDAINDLNMTLAQQVADSLPVEINGLKAEGESEISAAGMGMMGGGMQIIKRYRNETKNGNDAEVQILANSPMLSTLNMYVTNPGMMGPGYKSVRVGTNRAIAKTDLQDDGSGSKTRSTEIQIPLGQTLITIRANGFATEQDEIAFATKLDLEKIRTALGE